MRKIITLATLVAALAIPASASAQTGGQGQGAPSSFFGSFFGPMPSCTAAIGWQGIAAGCAQPGYGPAYLAWFGPNPGWPH